MRIRTLIVDDEPLARRRLRQFDRQCTFELREGGDRGATVEIAIPVRR